MNILTDSKLISIKSHGCFQKTKLNFNRKLQKKHLLFFHFSLA
ncbi:hypothetical protein LEP1GSC020_3311 [Leptospira interrogans serovar Grippotyphosa str. 2006006986]|uniref:Uncharacterized protein n=4 Tax=Leptospira interrogans TaxID=173 RepID=A0A0F6HA87_LEPIR|nr:hypothetical protein G436_3422 [Leptospira interrogans serovar Hardjo str. Norma]EJP04272.1 hypothetical protein LEP1GSC007_0338 [Leptospira interrogans serovar Bulgarica str. Mallika]EJP16801.1 hypothetical protein LEP1GSC080_3130 [Leptospira interrogans str. FPW2026]EKO25185.1 hypothetical protein LEP1GSC104_3556 [Leptospira interrogans str. UI 12621]EKO85704.1 hypothetical protein LEP1GSC009_0618 [Leptospira interrogans serovar Grippotyphosa str. Andaman]EKO96556.1 hypothetical protein L